ncbi:MAG TPA: ATP-binding cassette domain-containing protein [Gemmataceae bacterium]|nr:ATP-binding cassette domain-containing protein [Gemmataceae bacterium]
MIPLPTPDKEKNRPEDKEAPGGSSSFSSSAPSSDAPQVTESAVRIRHLYHRFSPDPSVRATLEDNNLTIEPGVMVVMTGPSGSGKTTLLTLIGGIRTVQEGSIRVLGRELFGMSSQQLMAVRRDIGFIFQAHNLFDALTARQNVRMALELKKHNPAGMDRLADEMLTQVGLAARVTYKPALLSGGQKQRVAIARALVNHPRLILADEPTAALDKESGATVVRLLKEHAQEGATILLVTHDQRILNEADRIVHMIDGRISSVIHVQEALAIVEVLRKCPVFEHETLAELTEMSQKMTMERFSAGAVLIRQGDEGDKFYVIRDGEVEVRRDRGGPSPEIFSLRVGDFFGETALLTGTPRNASVIAMTDGTVYSLQKSGFDDALRACPPLKEQILKVFAQRG